MPKARITMPDGRTAVISGTREQIEAAIQQLQGSKPTIGSELKSATAGGVGRGLANAFGALEGATNWVYEKATGRPLPGADDVAGQFREYVGEQYGQPQTRAGRLLEAPIRGATTGAALPLGPLTGPALAASAVGETSGQVAQEAGAPPWAQVAASMVGGMGTSMGMAARARRGAAAGRRAAAGLPADDDLAIAERLAAERLRRSLGGLTEDARRSRAGAAAQALDEEVAARAQGAVPLSTATVLERQAPGVESLQRGLARVPGSGDDLAARMADQRMQLESRLGQEVAAARSGAPAALDDAYRAVQDDLSDEVNKAYRHYRKLRGTDPPPVNAKPLRIMARRIQSEIGDRFPSDAKPSVVDDLADTGELTLKELDEFRSLATNEAAKAAQAGNRALARNWYRMRDASERTLSRFALGSRDKARKVDALRQAIGRRREMGQLFDEKHASAQMFEYDSLVDGMKKRVLNSKDPAADINRVRLIISRSDNAEEATRALQSVTHDAVFGPSAFADITAGEFKKARNALMQPRNRAAIDAAYHPGYADELMARFERARRALSETVGTPGEAHKTGSNVIGRVFDAVIDLKTNAGITFTRTITRRIAGVSEEKMNEALIRVFTDPAYASRLLKHAQAQDVEGFMRNITRGAAEGARPTIGRIGGQVEE